MKLFILENEMLPTISLVDRRIQDLVNYYGKNEVSKALRNKSKDAVLTMHINNLILTYNELVNEYWKTIYKEAV